MHPPLVRESQIGAGADRAHGGCRLGSRAKHRPSIALVRGVCVRLAVRAASGAVLDGLIATRELDMYGDRPALASLVNEVQREFEAAFGRSCAEPRA